MKNSIMKFGLALVVILGTAITSSAQIKLGANAMVGMPMGDFGDLAGTGFGGGITAQYAVMDNLDVGLEAGFLTFAGETIDFGIISIEGPSIQMIPILLTGQWNFMPDEDFNFYAGLGAGLYMVTPEGGDAESDLGLSPRIGATYGLSDGLALNLNAQYNMVLSEDDETGTPAFNYLGINLGVVYSLD